MAIQEQVTEKFHFLATLIYVLWHKLTDKRGESFAISQFHELFMFKIVIYDTNQLLPQLGRRENSWKLHIFI